jgi:hypothetical protein
MPACQWCNQSQERRPRTGAVHRVVRGRDGPFKVCATCRGLGLRMGYQDVTERQEANP